MGKATDGSAVVLIQAKHFPPPVAGPGKTIEAVSLALVEAVEDALNSVGGFGVEGGSFLTVRSFPPAPSSTRCFRRAHRCQTHWRGVGSPMRSLAMQSLPLLRGCCLCVCWRNPWAEL
jgi:hypothetical protein